MKNKCTPGNVVGYYGLGKRELEGLGVDDIDLFDGDPEVVSGWNSARHNISYNALREFNPQAFNAAQAFSDTSKAVGDALNELVTPESAIGDDIVKSIEALSEKHFLKYGDNLKAGKDEFIENVTELLSSIDTSKFTPNQQAFFNKYSRFYMQGGEFYKMNHKEGILGIVRNATSNTIKSSVNVVEGNVFEGVIKLPTFYPKQTLPAIVDALKQTGGNLFKELPERAAKGVYGHNFSGEAKDWWQGFMGLTDVPFKNIVYSAGELAETGSGTRAVEKVAFKPRFGNLPPVYYSEAGGQAVKLLGYRLNHYRMLHGMVMDAIGRNGASRVATGLQQIATHTVMTGLVGGFGATGVGQLLGILNPNWREEIGETRNSLASLVDTGGITQIGIGASITNRFIQNGYKHFADTWEATGATGDGFDPVQFTIGLTDVVMDALALGSTKTAFSDVAIQKAIKLARDTFLGEVAAEDFWDEAQDRFKLPNPAEVFTQFAPNEGDQQDDEEEDFLLDEAS